MAPIMSRQDTRARAEQAFRLRAVGRTYEEIAAELGFGSRSAARAAIERLHHRSPAPSAGEVRRTAAEGLRLLQAVLFEQVSDAKLRNDNEDLTRLVKETRATITEFAKLYGAYAPVKSQVDVNIHQDAIAIIDRMETDLLAITARNRGEIIEGEVVE